MDGHIADGYPEAQPGPSGADPMAGELVTETLSYDAVPRTYLVAGTLEPFFLDNAARWAAALRDAGADVGSRSCKSGFSLPR